MVALVTKMIVLAATPFHQAAALVLKNTDTPVQWVGEHTLHELYDNDTIEQLQKDGFMKTRQNPDHPHRKQYFVVKTPSDAVSFYSPCPHHDELVKVQNHDVAKVENLGKEWINTEKLQEKYGDDKVEELVNSGRLEQRQNPDFPKNIQLGMVWMSSEELLEEYGFDLVEELLTTGRVEKRQNPSCPERTQYYVKEEPLDQTDEEVQKLKESEADNRDEEAKMQNDGKGKKHQGKLHKRGYEEAGVQKHGKAKVQKDDEANVEKPEKAQTHAGKSHKHHDEEADTLKDDDAKMLKQEEAEMQKHGKAKDADALNSGKERSAAITAHVLPAVVSIIAVAFFA